MLLLGFLMLAYGGSGVDVFGIEVVVWNIDLENFMKLMFYNKVIVFFVYEIYGLVGYILVGVVILYIVGVLKYYLIDKDGIL